MVICLSARAEGPTIKEPDRMSLLGLKAGGEMQQYKDYNLETTFI